MLYLLNGVLAFLGSIHALSMNDNNTNGKKRSKLLTTRILEKVMNNRIINATISTMPWNLVVQFSCLRFFLLSLNCCCCCCCCFLHIDIVGHNLCISYLSSAISFDVAWTCICLTLDNSKRSKSPENTFNKPMMVTRRVKLSPATVAVHTFESIMV